jgi:hypothetical protein
MYCKKGCSLWEWLPATTESRQDAAPTKQRNQPNRCDPDHKAKCGFKQEERGLGKSKFPFSPFVVICGSGFQARQNCGKMPLPQNKETNLLGEKKEAGTQGGEMATA